MLLYKNPSGDSRGEGGRTVSFYSLFMGGGEETDWDEIKKTAAYAAAHIQVSFIYPALAV